MRRLIIVCFLWLSVSCYGQSLCGNTWKEVSQKGSGTLVFINIETPALASKDADGVVQGLGIDILRDFVSYVNTTKGVSLELVQGQSPLGFRSVYDSVRFSKGGLVGAGSITITDERRREVRFTPSYISNYSVLISQATVPLLISLEDLPKEFAGLVAYTPRGTLNARRILELKQQYYPAMKVSFTANGHDALMKILADPHGFGYLDFFFYYQALQEGKSIRRHVAGDVKGEQIGFILPPGSDWAPLFDEFFAANGGYKNSTHYRDILRKHLGETGLMLLENVK